MDSYYVNSVMLETVFKELPSLRRSEDGPQDLEGGSKALYCFYTWEAQRGVPYWQSGTFSGICWFTLWTWGNSWAATSSVPARSSFSSSETWAKWQWAPSSHLFLAGHPHCWRWWIKDFVNQRLPSHPHGCQFVFASYTLCPSLLLMFLMSGSSIKHTQTL